MSETSSVLSKVVGVLVVIVVAAVAIGLAMGFTSGAFSSSSRNRNFTIVKAPEDASFKLDLVFVNINDEDKERDAILAARDRWIKWIISSGLEQKIAARPDDKLCDYDDDRNSYEIEKGGLLVFIEVRNLDEEDQPAPSSSHQVNAASASIRASSTTNSTANNEQTTSVLAAAGPCAVVSGDIIPVIGQLLINEGALDTMLKNDLLQTVVEHEFAHVFGVGTLWNDEVPPNFLESDGDTVRYNGNGGIEGHEMIGADPGDAKPFVETSGGGGTALGHWEDEKYPGEALVGTLDTEIDHKMSKMTIKSLEDIKFSVDEDEADEYSIPSSSSSLRASSGTDRKHKVFRFGNDIISRKLKHIG